MSKPVDMVAGLFYYIEAVHASRGDKTDEFKVGVVPPSQKTQFPIKKDSLRQFRPSKIFCFDQDLNELQLTLRNMNSQNNLCSSFKDLFRLKRVKSSKCSSKNSFIFRVLVGCISHYPY